MTLKDTAKEVNVYVGAHIPPDENGARRHNPTKWYFCDAGYSSPVPMSPAYDTDDAAREGARAYCARFNDRYVADG